MDYDFLNFLKYVIWSIVALVFMVLLVALGRALELKEIKSECLKVTETYQQLESCMTTKEKGTNDAIRRAFL